MEPTEIAINAIIAALVASFYAYMGYRANKKESPLVTFNLFMALSIIVPTFLLSLVASFTGIAPDILSNASFSFVVTQLIKKAFKAS